MGNVGPDSALSPRSFDAFGEEASLPFRLSFRPPPPPVRFTTLAGVRFQALGHKSNHMQRTWWRRRYDTDVSGSEWEQAGAFLTLGRGWVLKPGSSLDLSASVFTEVEVKRCFLNFKGQRESLKTDMW